MLFFQPERHLVQNVFYNLAQVYLLFLYQFRCLVHSGQHRDVAQQEGQAVALGIASFQEDTDIFLRNVRVADNGFQVSLNAADGRFQLMGDVLCQLAFQAGLFFFLRNIVDGYFE